MKYIYSDELQHHGVLGQKWGVRRYQYKNGKLTPMGKRRAKQLVSDRDSNYFKYFRNKLDQDNYKREAYNGNLAAMDAENKKLINDEIQATNELRDKLIKRHLDDKLVVAYADNFNHQWAEGRPYYLKIDDINTIEEYGIRDRKNPLLKYINKK